MPESFDKGRPSAPGKELQEQAHQETTKEELDRYKALQVMFALVDFVEAHGLAIDPSVIFKRSDLVAQRIRNNAGKEWAAAKENEPSYAQVFERYWKKHADQLMKLNMNDPHAFKEKLNELKNYRRQLMYGGG
jgi:hypothetical protein